MNSNWGQILNDLMKQHSVSQRRLALIARVNRGTIRAMIKGEGNYHMSYFETLFGLLGYELDAFKVAEPDPRILPDPRKPKIPKPVKPGLIRIQFFAAEERVD